MLPLSPKPTNCCLKKEKKIDFIIRKSSWSTPTPGAYAKSLLNQLGCVSCTTGYWAHDLMNFGLTVIGPLGPIISMKTLQAVRARALKKKERLNNEKKAE